jgi:hypothetical protein
LNQSADTYFSHPGRTTIQGKSITGFVSHSDDREYHFHPDKNHKNYVYLFGVPVSCRQCRMANINGLPCHESGCPTEDKRWDYIEGEWIAQYTCRECGQKVDIGTPCCQEDE